MGVPSVRHTQARAQVNIDWSFGDCFRGTKRHCKNENLIRVRTDVFVDKYSDRLNIDRAVRALAIAEIKIIRGIMQENPNKSLISLVDKTYPKLLQNAADDAYYYYYYYYQR